MPFSNKNTINLKEASQITGYHPDYISALIRGGKLGGARVGRSWVVNRNEVERYAKNINAGSFSKWKIFCSILGICAVTAGLGFWVANYIRSSEITSSNKSPKDVLRVVDGSSLELAGESENYKMYEPALR